MSQNHRISPATPTDAPQISLIVNGAYRGESARKGWTTEADLLDGQRTDPESLQSMMQSTGSTILKYENAAGTIIGCVYLQQKGDALYLGMLTVDPGLQGSGIGKELLKAAEEYGREVGCKKVTMTVISVRHELISWYERHGYVITGEKQPFPTDPKFGLPRRPLEFIVMEKAIHD